MLSVTFSKVFQKKFSHLGLLPSLQMLFWHIFLLTLFYHQVGHKLVVKSTKATIDVGLPR